MTVYPQSAAANGTLLFALDIAPEFVARGPLHDGSGGEVGEVAVRLDSEGKFVLSTSGVTHASSTTSVNLRTRLQNTANNFPPGSQIMTARGTGDTEWELNTSASDLEGVYDSTAILYIEITAGDAQVYTAEIELGTTTYDVAHTLLTRTPASAANGADMTVSSPEKGWTSRHGTLWEVVRRSYDTKQFKAYDDFVSAVMCDGCSWGGNPCKPRRSDCDAVQKQLGGATAYRYGSQAYKILKAATEVFLLAEGCCIYNIAGTEPGTEREYGGSGDLVGDLNAYMVRYLENNVSTDTLPYLDRIITATWGHDFDPTRFGSFPLCEDGMRNRLCLIELIWSFWHESGQLSRSIAAIAQRFQNLPVKGAEGLRNLELSPLRPLNNLLWGYVRDAPNRLTVRQRAAEYRHEYGLELSTLRPGDPEIVDNRSRFIDTFHMLLRHASRFYKEDAHEFIQPDAFRMLNTLRDLHVVLAEGAHNSFGDLPTTSRVEMMTEQWLLAQEPMRLLLQTREMVPYEERWMGQVDSLAKILGWQQPSVSSFHRLAVYGEQLILSIRFTDWVDMAMTSSDAQDWARYWKPQVQGYIEAYYAVTGVDLADSSDRSLRAVNTQQPARFMRGRQLGV
ncbi:MAG: hypothetical protein AAFX79_02985 [Planctomycetota bacterium]